MEMKERTLQEFAALTASDAPAPGGGGVAAAVGALAAALAAMVAQLTVGKKGYEDAAGEMQRLIADADALRLALLDDIERDCVSFDSFMAAMALPKQTEEEKRTRSAAMQAALREAAETPLAIAARAAAVLPLAKAAVSSGNKNLVTDGMIAAVLARAACVSALYNVKINLASLQDEAYVDSLRARVNALQQEAMAAEAAVLALRPDLA